MAKIIAICGKICCGKTYYANQIKVKENAVILSCDELTKELFDNDLGEKHDEMALRIWSYLKKKLIFGIFKKVVDFITLMRYNLK